MPGRRDRRVFLDPLAVARGTQRGHEKLHGRPAHVTDGPDALRREADDLWRLRDDRKRLIDRAAERRRVPRHKTPISCIEDFAMAVQPYLFFDGRCEEAIDFYSRALGAADVMMMRFKDAPDTGACPQDPANAGKVMHARFRIGGSEVMASDGRCGGRPQFE